MLDNKGNNNGTDEESARSNTGSLSNQINS